ncbi:MAG: alanine--tRNA ligase, partial [Bdellovibrionales bacterium]|nr:alanine--tRNA ligase [Bdellovibrionales bacterium]
LRYAQKISEQKDLFHQVCATCIQEMSPYYPELATTKNVILREVDQETQKFLSTLTHGTQILEEHLHQLRKSGKAIVDGKMAFKLYDTYGFPLDLTQLIAREQGFQVHVNDFSAEMEKARQTAKAARKSNSISSNEKHVAEWTKNIFSSHGKTDFAGYSSTVHTQQKPIAMSDGEQNVTSLKEGSTGFVVFKTTPFYAESGGQIGDEGEITDGLTVADVFDCTKINDVFVHHVQVKAGILKLDAPYNLNVKVSRRHETAKHHSATHLLNAALRHILGNHVAQAGSLVNADKLRFDFKHPQAVSPDELTQIEDLVNEQIINGIPGEIKIQKYDEAVKAGAVAMAGEKYSDEVRVLSFGSFSKELCGGTHVANTSEIGVFKIVSESSVSAGVRRIEALTGASAIRYLRKNTQENIQARKHAALPTQWEAYLDGDSQRVDEWMAATQAQIQTLKKQMSSLQTESIDAKDLISQAQSVKSSKGDLKLLVVEIPMEDRAILNEAADKVRDHSQNTVFVIIGSGNPKALLVGCNKSVQGVHCGELLKKITQTFGGKGGGRPDFAQGSIEKVDKAALQKLCAEFLA